ncbi:CerR family C-terminal domain-containing protein [Paraburkholderia strydomiana]|uniref:TetR/AcrR family transcriptional regulator n=1 Tax=Paraburkholderia strydomiana TaxID=1245417 RepID=UPI0038BAB245
MPTKPVTTAGRVDRKEKAGKAQGTTQTRATQQTKQKKQTKRAVQPDGKPRANQSNERETPPRPKAAKRASRPDGAATRQHLLDIAGQVFAARGFADATSKEICERAGTPMASVNYHFGSREALYEAALVEAHRQVVSLDELAALTEGAGDPRDKLRAVISRFVGLSTSTSAPWGFMLMLREMLSPSPAIPALIEKAVRPKATVLLGLMGDVLQLNPQEPTVQRAVMFTVLPCIALMIAPRQAQAALLPAVAKDKNALVEDFVRFVMAGLDAVAAAHRARK